MLGETGCENVVPRNWGTAKGKTPHHMADGFSWALPTGTGGVNRTLWFCQIRARGNGELSYRNEQRGDPGGASASGSVEGTAGQAAPRTSGSSWPGETERWVVVSQNPEFWSQPAPSAGKVDTAWVGQGNSACPKVDRFSVRVGAVDGCRQREEGKTCIP